MDEIGNRARRATRALRGRCEGRGGVDRTARAGAGSHHADDLQCLPELSRRMAGEPGGNRTLNQQIERRQKARIRRRRIVILRAYLRPARSTGNASCGSFPTSSHTAPSRPSAAQRRSYAGGHCWAPCRMRRTCTVSRTSDTAMNGSGANRARGYRRHAQAVRDWERAQPADVVDDDLRHSLCRTRAALGDVVTDSLEIVDRIRGPANDHQPPYRWSIRDATSSWSSNRPARADARPFATCSRNQSSWSTKLAGRSKAS